jgi:two-component sensor histidine kinase
VSHDDPHSEPSRWESLPTGLKMLLIMSLGLLPLGIIAVLASIDNAGQSRARAELDAQAILAVHAQRFTLGLSRNAAALRAARDVIVETQDGIGICARTLARLANAPNVSGRFALFGIEGRLRCATEGFVPPPVPPAPTGRLSRTVILPGGEMLRAFLFDPAGHPEAIVEYRRETLATLIDTPALDGNFGLELVQGDRAMLLRRGPPTLHPADEVTADFPFASGQFSLRIHTAPLPLTISELLVILTPILMWIWASVVGWIIVQHLLLRPLARIQSVISAYKPGDRELDLPTVHSPAREIGALGQAFDRVTRTVAQHEAELENAVARQTRLVREVHHRVKNNLQVVASLLNLHSRGSPNEEVAAAYASIQRRVDALAVVHRNHYAELEENRGVALKPLVSELAANLRATAPPGASSMQIRLDVAPCYVNQDVAVSVAFLITEVVEFGMLCGAGQVSVVLEPDEGLTARLTIEVDALAGAVDCDERLSDRFERIITGLARQLRSALDRDPDHGRYAVTIGIVAKGSGTSAG